MCDVSCALTGSWHAVLEIFEQDDRAGSEEQMVYLQYLAFLFLIFLRENLFCKSLSVIILFDSMNLLSSAESLP